MANIKIKNLDKVFAKIKEAISDLPDSMYADLEKITVERIVQKARTGKTMAYGEEEKLKELSQSYIEQRQGKVKFWKAGGKVRAARPKKGEKFEVKGTDPQFFSPKRSNLTFTGQYLRSFKKSKLDRKKGRLEITPQGVRKEGLSNKKLAKYLGEQGRSIFGLDSLGKKRLFQRVKEELRRRLRKK